MCRFRKRAASWARAPYPESQALHNLGQVRAAVLEGASYLGVGPTFSSPTKEFGSLAGLEFVRQVAGETALPAFVLGGE